MTGWVKVHRDIINKSIYQQPPLYLRVFERLIIEANCRCKRILYNRTTKLIRRGEKLTSIGQIAEWVGWYERGIFKVPNKKTISDILNWLIDNELIEIYNKGNARETHYNIVNYYVYQSMVSDESNAQVTTSLNSSQNSHFEQKSSHLGEMGNDKSKILENESNAQVTALNTEIPTDLTSINVTKVTPTGHKQEYKEYKNNNKRLNNKNIYAHFEKLWSIYPKKLGKGKISDKQKKKLYEISFEEMQQAIERYKKANEGADYQFLQYGSTFFNSGYLDYLGDDYKEPPKSVPKKGTANFKQREYSDEHFKSLYVNFEEEEKN